MTVDADSASRNDLADILIKIGFGCKWQKPQSNSSLNNIEFDFSHLKVYVDYLGLI